MPATVSQQPFIIRPPADLLESHPQLRHMANDLARQYADRALVTDEMLQAIGQGLWQALAGADALAQARQAAGPRILPVVIDSDQPAIQQLPWETLYHPEHSFLGQAPGFTLSRRTAPPPEPLPPESGPLRVLLFTSLPDDVDAETSRLDVEEEQAQVQEALMPWLAQGLVELEMPDDGRLATLREQLRSFQPHLLFLSGHGKFHHQPHSDEPPYAIFLFESDSGRSDPVRGRDIAPAFMGSSVQCVVLSACESGKAASEALNHGLARQLSGLGLPHVIGMRESLLDRAGILFARTLADALAQRERVDVALQQARQAITRPLKEMKETVARRESDLSGAAELSLGQWCLPQLISPAADRPLIDWDFEPQPLEPRQTNQTLQSISLPPRFVGRRSELRNLKSRLRRGDLRQLLITGPGGQGKTALAGKLAQDLELRAGYSVLAWSARPENSWSAFMLELEFQLNGENAKRYDRMAARYQAEADKATLLLRLLLAQSDNRLLLFFDNLESLQDGRSLALSDARLQAWIRAAQGLAGQGLILLLTSRWRLPAWPEADHWPLEHASYGDFLQMARQQLAPAFFRERDRLRQVYQTLHGNGRGLEFFAAAVQGMSLAEEEAFLAKLAQAEAESQADMALARIVAHLSDDERTLLARLPAYASPVPAEGIIKLALDLPRPAALLARLLAVSLVERQTSHAWRVHQYQCPPLVLDWLAGQDVAPPGPDLLRSAAAYQQYLYRLERPTLTQAILTHQALRRAGQQDEADRLALDAIVGPLNRAGLYRTLLDDWLPDICQSPDKATRATALNLTGLQLDYVGDYETALTYYKQSLAIRQEIGDKSGEGTTLNNIGEIFRARGDYEAALSYYKQSLAIQKEIGDKAGEGRTLNNIGNIYHARGDYDTALIYLKQSLAISEEIGDKAGQGPTLNGISLIYSARGDYEAALRSLKQSLAIRQEIGDKSGEGTTLNNIAGIYRARGDYETALTYLKQSLAISQEIGDKAGEGATLNNISQIFKARGDYETALTYLKQSLAISQEIGDKSGEGTTLNNIGEIFRVRGDYETALTYLKQSLAIRQEIGDKAGEGTTLNNISQIFKARGDYETALTYCKQSLAIRQEIGDKSGEGTTLNNIGEIFWVRGDYETALSYYKQSLAISQEIGDKSEEGGTLNNMATTAYARGDYETALTYCKQSLAISQEIGDVAGMCGTLINMGHIHWQNEEPQEAVGLWVKAYTVASRINYAQALQALENMANQLGLEGGLAGWEALAERLAGE